jgi:hypothetical protein
VATSVATSMHSLRRWSVLAIWLTLGPALTWLRGADDTFTATLTPDQQASAGVAKLTEAERETIDTLVAREAQLARQGGVAGFAGTFVSRRTVDDRAQSGIDRLSDDEQKHLNDLAAVAIATRPYVPAFRLRELKVEPPPPDPRALQIHGQVSFTYGWASHGGSFKGGSIETTIVDPKHGTTFTFGYARYQGDLRLIESREIGWSVRRP